MMKKMWKKTREIKRMSRVREENWGEKGKIKPAG